MQVGSSRSVHGCALRMLVVLEVVVRVFLSYCDSAAIVHSRPSIHLHRLLLSCPLGLRPTFVIPAVG